MNKLIETKISEGKNKGYCFNCQEYFKKGDCIIIFDKVKVDRAFSKKICGVCYLKLLADRIGWSGISALILKHSERNI